MNRLTPGQYEARAKIAKALAHPTRLLMLDALKRRETCVCELTDLIGADQSTVSKHLAILKNAGLVEGRRAGTMTLYRVHCVCLDEFFDCIENVLRQNLKVQQAMLTGRREVGPGIRATTVREWSARQSRGPLPHGRGSDQQPRPTITHRMDD
jgi:ArsR family transcriptional regulator